MNNWDETVDLVIVGSGGGSMCAALACIDLGMKPLILEKQDKVGGSTAMSGGILWVPMNPLMAEAGVEDSFEAAMTYFEALVPEQPGSTRARKEAYLRTGPKMIEWLRSKGIPMIYCDGWPDYYDEMQGSVARGRSVAMKLFDVRKLGAWKNRLRRNYWPFPIEGGEARRLALALRTVDGALTAVRVGWRLAKVRLFGLELAAAGAAIQGWMLHTALKAGIDIRTEAGVSALICEDGKVVGVTAHQGERTVRIRAARGVLINAGGFARNAEMRKAYGPQPSSTAWTVSNPGDTGEMINAAIGLGAAVHGLDRAIWTMASILPDGRPGLHAVELGKPHLILVDRHGKRFTDEACSYMETGERVYQAGAVPCWAILDSRHRQRYNWAQTPPRHTPAEWLSSGYMKKADTIEELAALCGIDPAGLADTVRRFNGFAAQGVDEDFKRGARAYDRYWGDRTHGPNPSLGEISKPPFYAVELYPGDVGTYGGLVTDEFGRVLDKDGEVIQGLYATGNSTASVTGACYPGAGASIAASFIFAYRAAHHASPSNSAAVNLDARADPPS